MAANLDEAAAQTRDVLQSLFAKPKLSTKLLSKPPFRFIHDIVVATLRATGFPNGFFSLEELDSSNFKDSKSAKVSFLNKLIHLVSVGHGSTIDVSSSKIVAGLEPLKTNALLATFGRLAQDEKLERDDLIQHCLAGKSVEEFQSKTAAAPATKTDADIEGGSPTPPDDPSTKQYAVEQSGSIILHPVLEQIKGCNEEVEQTKATISAIVSKPKCSDKLLNKPPFRFIHDLIMAIGKQTEFDLLRIFSEEELVSSNVKDKQPKLQFLEKLISFLETNLETTMKVKPTKIISGLEPERTRYLLQVFSVVATTKCLAPTGGVGTGYREVEHVAELKVDEAAKTTAVALEGGKEDVSLTTAEGIDEKNLPSDTNGQEDSFVEAKVELPSSEPSASISDEGVEPLIKSPTPNAADRPASAWGERPSAARSLDDSSVTTFRAIRPATARLSMTRGTKDGPTNANAVIRPATAIIKDGHNPAVIEGLGSTEEVKATAEKAPRVILPPRLSDYDFQSLAEAIQGMAAATAPLGSYLNGIPDDAGALLRERRHWMSQQGGNAEGFDSMHRLQAKLQSLETTVEKQVSSIKRLEANVQKNDAFLKQHGVTHAY